MISLRIRSYGSSEHTQVTFTGEMENELCAQLIAALQAGFVWPGQVEDLHLLTWSDDLGRWVEA